MSEPADKSHIDHIITQFFGIFNNTGQQQIDWTILNRICIAETIIIKKTGLNQTVYDMAGFIEPRKSILADGTMTEFQEKELTETTRIVGRIAQRYSTYQKTGYLNGTYFIGTGTKLFQLINTVEGWKISSLVWEDD